LRNLLLKAEALQQVRGAEHVPCFLHPPEAQHSIVATVPGEGVLTQIQCAASYAAMALAPLYSYTVT